MNAKKMLIGIVLSSLLAALTGCTSTPGEQGKVQNNYSKEIIRDELNSDKGLSKITWSPDNKKVIYLQKDIDDNNIMDKIYLWKVGEEKAEVVKEVSKEIYSFIWSPDNQYFLISKQQGGKYENNIVKAKILAEEKYKLVSTDLPVWSPDSLSLAFSNEEKDSGEEWGSLEVYTIKTNKREFIWRARNTQYRVEFWDKEGNISYKEVYKGVEARKTTKNIRPSISGVHLGDNRDQVKTALGNDYKEIPPTGETGHFPEQVYRWDYNKGYKIFFGEKSGKVIEIIAAFPQAETNLGVKIGDSADKVFKTYRPQYIEPESIHGGKLIGIFKVEGAAALYFDFVMKEGESQFSDEIKSESKVERMILTYPEHMDDSF
ncbi:MAG: hypothetical protein K0R09_1509 [Clostridiales bacterium]|jgi:dipeptidyl aminopeptidase/acylaminoacyl peptidase|nr:hypothetical protein [Clostridiales bacterium]